MTGTRPRSGASRCYGTTSCSKSDSGLLREKRSADRLRERAHLVVGRERGRSVVTARVLSWAAETQRRLDRDLR